ncbi:MAG TPA: prepilin-type N-terminal cleavage/methylation domain-containing protein [Bryobacteraceae bacterium]|nr:prepilin-type N-terminal cleavage/methylation domain-containing protein [Bryobacteraceae bacterium]
MRRGEAGVTLIEILVAVTLLSLLSLGMVMAMRIGLAAYSKTETKLMDTRRVVGAQRIVQSELEGLIPALITCGGISVQAGGPPVVLFRGAEDGMWMVSAFSLAQGWRGQPQILQLFVMSGDEGVRLVVNEIPYTGAAGAGQLCTGTVEVPNSIARLPQMIPVRAGPQTFVLADKLAYCRFAYYTPPNNNLMNQPPTWQPVWAAKGWPLAIRIEMAPAKDDPSHVQPISITAPIHIRRDPEKVSTDGN